nr:hypothetical protein [Burkholderia pseudomultivorans]
MELLWLPPDADGEPAEPVLHTVDELVWFEPAIAPEPPLPDQPAAPALAFPWSFALVAV